MWLQSVGWISLLVMKDKQKFGQYFTADAVAQFMVSLVTHDKAARVLEPSCGRGIFLRHLANAGFANVSAYEIDPNLDVPFDGVRRESFVTSPLEPYDVVIGNPPYIRWKNLEPELRKELTDSTLWNTYFNSLCDYLFIFVLKSIEQLTDGGELVFICTEYWMNTTHSAPLRDYMMRHGYFSDIYHFKEARLFDGVCASFIIFRYVKSSQRRDSIRLCHYEGEETPQLGDLMSHSCFRQETIPQFGVGKRWILASSARQECLGQFERSCQMEERQERDTLHRIGDVCDIGNGMVSGMDRAFNVSDLPGLNATELSCVIKVLKAKNLGQYHPVSESRYFFVREKMSEADFRHSMPHIYNHFLAYKEGLKERYDYGKDIPYWEFVFPRNLSLFMRPQERIFVPCKERISNKGHFRFVLAQKEFFPLQDVTALLRKSTCRESIEYLTAYLNNPRVFEWLGFNGVVKGHIVEFSEAPLASIPYRPIHWDNPREVSLHDQIRSNVRQYIATQKASCLAAINHDFDMLFSRAV